MDYAEIYKKLNIKPQPLQKNYNPNEYARQLLSKKQKSKEVSYSNSTKIDKKTNTY